MKPNMMYQWEIETEDKVVLRQYEPDGKENTWKTLDASKVVRVSFLPSIALLPTHTVIINKRAGERFVKRFARGFVKSEKGYQLAEYVNCVVTNRYRFWVFSTGMTMVTDSNYELKL